jgi:chromosome partitioning protein
VFHVEHALDASPALRYVGRSHLHHVVAPQPGSQQLSRILAIANQKGGVGKTTTAINLGACLAVAEKRTLVIDSDPQGNATSGLGIDKDALSGSIYEVLVEGARIDDVIQREVHFPFLDVVPATRDLVGAEVELVGRAQRETILRRAVDEVADRYDYVLIDSPPSLGLLTLNALSAADSVLIPIQCEFYALEGLTQLLNSVRAVQRNLNPRLQIEGVLMTMYDQRLNLSKQVAEEARQYFGPKVYRSTIPRNVRIAEAPSFGKPIVLYDILSVGAKSYLALAQELIGRNEGRAGGARREPGGGGLDVPALSAEEDGA